MSATIDDLQRRLDAVEAELRDLRGRFASAVPTSPPTDGSVVQWLEAIRRENAATPQALHDAVRRALGIPGDLEPVGAKKLREMMIADGIRPEDCLTSRDIIRMREE